MAERISLDRSIGEGWLTVKEVRERTGLGHATVMERFKSASRDSLRVARLENGEWRLHKDDLEKVPRRYEDRGARRSRLDTFEWELKALKARLAILEETLAKVS